MKIWYIQLVGKDLVLRSTETQASHKALIMTNPDGYDIWTLGAGEKMEGPILEKAMRTIGREVDHGARNKTGISMNTLEAMEESIGH